MIISRIRELQVVDKAETWNSLRRFQNIDYVVERVESTRHIERRHRGNARKQAEQIRFCLLQASEYFQAAQSVSVAIKPLLLYYGVMSLALAEILFKQDGKSSLDAARGENAHHGLLFRVSDKPTGRGLQAGSSGLRAEPMIKSNTTRVGTFDLWHRTSRPSPVIALSETLSPDAIYKEALVLGTPKDTRMPLLRAGGVTLLDCFQSLPGMMAVLAQADLHSTLVRGRVDLRYESDGFVRFTLTAQGAPKAIRDSLQPLLEVTPELVDVIDLREFVGEGGGFFLSAVTPWHWGLPRVRFPNPIQTSVDEVFLSTRNFALNEFGVMYAGIYMLGNYARYFPDLWMADVERCTELATASEAFIGIVEQRAPLLTLSELSQTWHGLERRLGAQT